MSKNKKPTCKRKGHGKRKPIAVKRPCSASVVIVSSSRNNHDFINGEASNMLRHIINKYALDEAQVKEISNEDSSVSNPT